MAKKQQRSICRSVVVKRRECNTHSVYRLQ